MFEAGKQYKGKTTGRIVEVLFVGHRLTLLKQTGLGQTQNFPIGHEFTVDSSDCNKWEEYTPPKTFVQEKNVWYSGDHFYTSPGADEISSAIGRVRFTYTEGEPLKVEVL